MKELLRNKTTLILISSIIVLVLGGFFAYKTISSRNADLGPVEEVDLAFDAAGPYAILTPRKDGNALILSLKRTASYDKISYELAYNAEGIDRGVMGDINTKDKKGEYDQEILFGTCSKNVCKYDKGVENGTLTLHIRKGNKAFRMVTQWRLQQPDIALGKLASGDSHFSYSIDPGSTDLTLFSYSIINDLTGAPKLPNGKKVVGKVYAVNASLDKDIPAGQVGIETADTVPQGSKIARFSDKDNKWIEFPTESSAFGSLTAKTDTGGIFAVLAPSK